MSSTEQCPSSKKQGLPINGQRPSRLVSQATGREYWRSLDDLADTPEFRDFLEREFPANASELLENSRRDFLKIMGASLALAGAAAIPGCRRPDHRLIAYNTVPEEIIEGKPLYYATAMPLPGGGCEGLLARTLEGRPVKLEGNPLHPHNRGKSSVTSQSAILDLYDIDREPAWVGSTGAADHPAPATRWADFRRQARTIFDAFDTTRGERLAFLVDKSTSPTRAALKQRIMSRWPNAKWFVHEPADREHAIEGANIAFGRPVRPVLSLERADVVVCLNYDLLGTDATLPDLRGYSANRYRPGTTPDRVAGDAAMSRLYAIESNMTPTGGQADHRLRLRPALVSVFAVELARAVMRQSAGTDRLRNALDGVASELPTGDVPREWIDEVAKDLLDNRGRSVVLVGEMQPAPIHALVHAINEALGNVGQTVSYRPIEGDVGVSSSRAISELAQTLRAGTVDTLVVIGANPAYDAPAELDFAEAMGRAARTIYLGSLNETAAAAGTYLPQAHFLEAWGDVSDWDGAYSIIQPMIKPLWEAHSDIELLGLIVGDSDDGYDLVRRTLSQRVGIPTRIGSSGTPNPRLEQVWRRCLHDGVQQGSAGSVSVLNLRIGADRVAQACRDAVGAMRPASGIDVVFLPCSKLGAGQRANNPWLHELPEAVTKVTWDNPLLISKATAERLGIRTSRKLRGPLYNYVAWAKVEIDGKSIELPVWVQPGLADDTVICTLGYGRSVSGRVGQGTGFDVNSIRPSDRRTVVSGATVAPVRRAPYLIANTQDHWAIEGRDFFREVDLYWWRQHGDTDFSSKDAYGNKRELNAAGSLGLEGHTPLNRDIYLQRPGRRGSSIFYHKVDENGRPILDEKGRKQRPVEMSKTQGREWAGTPIQQWGMSIDLTTCTGCGACITACQAENNIPVVGKQEVAKGREMHWIRVDRYYATESMDDAAFADPDVAIQPLACVHCENAPCEVVCPVNATVHGTGGTNDMAYNRCIGTRYCSNNCPYKVRRFNYFDYATKEFRGEVVGLPGGSVDNSGLPGMTSNENFIPPRFRSKTNPVRAMQKNPHVTVRSRGVMEKCTYCIQRINSARVETKLQDLDHIPDGFFQTACQQACPTNAIVFGDIYDYDSNDGRGSFVSQLKADPRTFAMLAYLNVVPRTTHMLRIRNFNHNLRPRGENPFHAHAALDGKTPSYPPTLDENRGVLHLPVLNSAGAHA